MKILRDLESAGQKYPTLRAKVAFGVEMIELGDSEARTGWVAYQKETTETPTKVRVRFQTLRLGGGKVRPVVVDHAFDGMWYHCAKHRIKDITSIQRLPNGERRPLLTLGESSALPPLPFGQKADDVVKYFHVTLAPPAMGDPNDTDHLVLKRRRQWRKEIDYPWMDMWVDRGTHLPVKIRGKDRDENIKTITLTNFKTGEKFSDDMFTFREGQFGRGWEYTRKPLSKDRPAP